MTDLFHHCWNVPVLVALLDAGAGARAIVLMNVLGVSRNPLRASLSALRDLDLVIANPGYGHPLRPEFLLTDRGRDAATLGKRYCDLIHDFELTGLKWTAPTLLALAEHQHFNQMQDQLAVAPRPLGQTLKAVVDAGLVERRVDPGYPPRSSYRLVDRGRQAAAILDELACVLAPDCYGSAAII